MKYSDNSELAIKYLKQAIPSMMQHSIVPNPLNYTLWYTYYTNTKPALNRDMDYAIERHDNWSDEISENLFLQHIGQNYHVAQETNLAYQEALTIMVNDLSHSMSSAKSQTSKYADALQSDISALEEHSFEDQGIHSLIDSLSSNANAICSVNNTFSGKLESAQKEIKQLQKELSETKQQAHTDPLTGLSNRRLLDSIYAEFVEQKSNNDELSIIIMDIDKFKLFNDTYGHVLGDQILKYVATLLKCECDEQTKPIRFGGEEFAIFCPNYNIEASKQIAEKIRVKLASIPYTNKKTGESIPPVTASFGIAELSSDDDLTTIIERADKALYIAKEQGRNQVQVAA